MSKQNKSIIPQIVIRIAKVVSTEDANDGGRIKVKVLPSDNDKNINELPYAYPLLPKMFHVMPKVGEAVLLLLTAANDRNSIGYYIGPIIPQDADMEYAEYETSARALYPDSYPQLRPAPSNVPTSRDAFCNKEDIALYGRKGCEIIMKENDIRIRCGARVKTPEFVGMTFNYATPAYLKLKYYDTPQVSEKKTFSSVATLVADEINLISNNGSPNYGKEMNQKDMINDEQVKKIIDTAHPLPYGDTLVEFLTYFLQMFKEHAHPYPGMPTILPSGNDGFWTQELENMLSKNVRIN